MKRNFFGLCCAGMVLCLCFMACNKETKQEQKNPGVTLNQQEDDWVSIENEKNEEKRVLLNSGKVLENLTKVGADGPYYCNEEANLSNGKMTVESHLVCKDPVYDITYYVNYGRNYFIYASRSGESEVAVEIPAKELFCREGELYFIADSYSTYVFEGMESGNILKYNPVDGAVEVIVNKNVSDMRVFPDAINYYTSRQVNLDGYVGEFRSTEYYRFDDGNSTPLFGGDFAIDRWQDKGIEELRRTLSANEAQNGSDGEWKRHAGWALVNSEGERLAELADSGSFLGNFRIHENCIYYVKSVKEEQKAALMAFNCETGEVKQVVKFDVSGEIFTTSDFIILDDVVYLGSLYRYSLKEEKLTKLKYSGGDRESIVEALYTDGDELFGVADGYLWKIQIEKAKEDDVEVAKVNGDSVVYGEYMYSLVEP